MPSRTQDRIYETFAAVAHGHSSNDHSAIDGSERVTRIDTGAGKQIQTAKPMTWHSASPTAPGKSSTASNPSDTSAHSPATTVLQSVFPNVPLVGDVVGASTGGEGIGSTIESIASSVLKSGLGMVPLIGGLLGLFSGDDSPPAPILTKYAMPDSIAFQGEDVGSSVGLSDYDQMGLPRAYGGAGNGVSQSGGRVGPTPPSSNAGNTGGVVTQGSAGTSSGPGVAVPQITVNVQAMDARSFMDHSSDIAAAVREAMLNMNSINDVVSAL
ncbi:MAG TPA: hypothetical protein VKU19_25720 [Bryobacteraceae bacterium]|nr:hypothetical protein [Bryobacteraceae bacterium]